ncbi:MAG: hypothetical protein JSU72_19225, partial [Deltaproteobacteria bacterium]
MSSHNQEPNDKTTSSGTKQRRKWSRLMTIAFFSICVSMFGFAGFAHASVYDVSVTDATVNEADGKATFSVFVIPAVAGTDEVTVEVYTDPDTAEDETGDNDYIAVPKTDLVFTTGMTIMNVDVTINDDSKFEADERFKFLIGNVNNTGGSVTVSDPEGWGTITNDDAGVELKVKVFHDPGVNSVFVDWGTGSQTCSSDDDCLNLGGLFLPVGTVVTLTPIANATTPYTWAFNDWKKDGSGDDNPYTITVNSNM